METWIVAAVIFLAVFTQSLAGFGVALVAMALLPGLVGIRMAAPLVALVALLLEIVLLLRYRSAVNLRAVWPLALAATVSTPLGVWALKGVKEEVVLAILGVVIAGYALYALLDLHLPRLEHPLWGYAAGFLAGLIGGAYNTSGPPVIIYGECRRWGPSEFKGNLQGFFLLNSLVVVGTHAWQGNFTSEVWKSFVLSLPAIALGTVAGLSADRLLPPSLFRRVTLVVLFLMGVRLMF